MEISVRHGIEYEATEPVAVEDLIKSLEANARLLRDAGGLLAALYPGLSIDVRRVAVVSLSQESPLREVLILSMFVAFQEGMEAEVPALIKELTGMEVAENYETLVTVLALLIAIEGVSRAYDALFAGRDRPGLRAAAGGLLRRAVELSGVSAERIKDAVNVLLTGRTRRATVAASQKVFAPTRGQPAPSIRHTSGETLVSVEATREAQAAASLPVDDDAEAAPATVSELHQNVRIVLHATDRDRKRVGWAGHVPAIFDARVPMHLEKSIDPERLFGRQELQGDILLVSTENDLGEPVPHEFLLLRALL